MKRFNFSLVILLSVFAFQSLHCQVNTYILSGQKVEAIINDRGILFNNENISSAGYEAPKGSGNHLIYQGGFWFGGNNQNGDLKLAAQLFGQDYDFYRGPYSSTNSYNDTAYSNHYQGAIWGVTRSEIIYHINNYDQPNYTAPYGILNWPGNGNPAVGVSNQLAPFVDVNNNGIYEPYKGDYPCIKGYVAAYQIMHEDLNHENTGGGKIGAEIHIMVYQVLAQDYINSTTFIDVSVINKGQNSFTNFKTSFFLDTDIGYSEDDYVGSLPAKDLMYAYNGVSNDIGGQGTGPGYGNTPPAVGIISLNKDIEYYGTFYRPDIGTPETIGPNTASEYWNYMNGKWKDGTPWTYGGNGYGGTSGTTKFIYDGNPYQGTGWTEIDTDGNGTPNSPGDRRLVITSIEESFLPGDTLIYNYAILYNRKGDNLENVQGLINTADSVQNYFDTTAYSCQQGSGTSGLIKELKNTQLYIFPNPSSHQIKIIWEEIAVNDIKILSFQGKLVKKIPAKGLKGEKTIDVNRLAPGVYFVSIGNTMRKLIVQ